MRRWAGLAALVLVAMAAGRLITDHVPVDAPVSEPFVRTGSVGHVVHLRYADVTVTGVRSARQLHGVEVAQAAGVFLIADVRVVATQEATTLVGISLVDGRGRRYVPTDRAECPMNVSAPTGAPWYAMFCFDVPRTAFEGARLVVAKGDYGVNGSGQRRDDLGRIDLGIDHAEARQLAATTGAYRTEQVGFAPIEKTPVKAS